MALFKIQRGLSQNLSLNRPYANDGWAYFTTNDGKFYIDIDGDGTADSPAIIGTNRICLNAATADQVASNLILRINRGADEGRSQYTFNGSQERAINLASYGDGLELIANSGTILFKNSGVTEIKGANEANFRTGSVTITAANLIGPNAIGDTETPVYWNGTTFVETSASSGGSANFTIRRWATA